MENQVMDTITTVAGSSGNTHKVWFWIAVAEFAILLSSAFFLITRKRKQTMEIREKVMREGDIDFSNTMMSAFHAQALYDQLKVRCHPDRFPQDEAKNKLATELFQQVVQNKNNYRKLLELKATAEKELQITINQSLT